MQITRLELQTSDLMEQALFYGETLELDTRIIAGAQVTVRIKWTYLRCSKIFPQIVQITQILKT